MTLFYVLGIVVFIAAGVVGFLFYLLNKESAKEEEVKIAPLVNPGTLHKSAAVPTTPSFAEEEYKKKVEGLEEELRAISEKGVAQAQEAMDMVDRLTKENEALKAENQAAKQQPVSNEELAAAQRQAGQLRQDNDLLQTQLESAQVKLRQLQDEGVAMRKHMEDELRNANETVEQFKREREVFLASRESSTQSTQSMAREVEELRAQNATLREEAAHLQQANQKLKELNAGLMEKAQMLQYELVKNRAQASGLEKICENYKMQLAQRT